MKLQTFRFDKSLFSVTTSIGTVKLFSLAIPLLLENILNILPGTVNTMVLGAYSDAAVAAVGAANQILVMFSLFFTAVSLGAMVVISQNIGAEKLRAAGETSLTAVVICSGFSLVCIPFLFIFSGEILSLLNLTGEIYEQALEYYRIRIWFVAVMAISTVVLAVLKCYGYPKYTMISGLVTNVLNLVLTVVVVYFPEYSPVKGVAGVAWACVIGQTVGLLLSIYYLVRLNIKLLFPKQWRDFWRYAGQILKVGIPTGLSNAAFTIAQTVTTAFVALLGDYVLSAKVYFSTILSYTYLFSSSCGNANSILVGRLYGAGEYDRATRLNNQLVRITIPVNLLISLAVIVFRYQLVGIFTHDPKILALALGVFAVDLIAEQSRAVSQVYEYALRAAGDVLFNVVALTISCWCLSIGLAYVLAIPCGLGLVGCWIGVVLDEVFRAILTFIRWKIGVWIPKKQTV